MPPGMREIISRHSNGSNIVADIDSTSVTSNHSGSWDGSDINTAKPRDLQESIELHSLTGAVNTPIDDNEHEKELFNLHSRRGSNATVETFMLYTPDEEQLVIRKFDRNLVLFVALLYMLSFLDRSSKWSPVISK